MVELLGVMVVVLTVTTVLPVWVAVIPGGVVMVVSEVGLLALGGATP